MEARATCTCPDCTEPMAVRADVDSFPVPIPDVTTDGVVDGFDLGWSCPNCNRSFETKIVTDVTPSPIPWVGDVDGTEACIDVRPHIDMPDDADHVVPDFMEAMS